MEVKEENLRIGSGVVVVVFVTRGGGGLTGDGFGSRRTRRRLGIGNGAAECGGVGRESSRARGFIG